MLDPSNILDEIIAAQRTNTVLYNLLADASPASIYGYYQDGTDATNLQQAVEQQGDGTIMIAWVGTHTGTFARNEATKHDYTAFIRPIGRVTAILAAFVDAPIITAGAPNGAPFRISTIDQQCNPPTIPELIPQSVIIAGELGTKDQFPLTFTMVERGLTT